MEYKPKTGRVVDEVFSLISECPECLELNTTTYGDTDPEDDEKVVCENCEYVYLLGLEDE